MGDRGDPTHQHRLHFKVELRRWFAFQLVAIKLFATNLDWALVESQFLLQGLEIKNRLNL